MYCPKCGTENPDNAQICRSCNTALTSAAIQTAPAIPKTSGLAIASFVLGILSILTLFLTALPAIILGIISLVKISKSAGQLKGTGLAVAGIIIPPASLPVVALLMGILMPALARTRQLAFRMTCGTNMSGLAKAMLIYSSDYDQCPTPENWCDLLIKYAEVDARTFLCKGAPEGPCNYAINENLRTRDLFNIAPDLVLLFETNPGWNQSGGPEILTIDNHQGDGCNIAFADTHIEFVKTQRLKELRWKPD